MTSMTQNLLCLLVAVVIIILACRSTCIGRDENMLWTVKYRMLNLNAD